jgi:hypothetical protein
MSSVRNPAPVILLHHQAHLGGGADREKHERPDGSKTEETTLSRIEQLSRHKMVRLAASVGIQANPRDWKVQ